AAHAEPPAPHTEPPASAAPHTTPPASPAPQDALPERDIWAPPAEDGPGSTTPYGLDRPAAGPGGPGAPQAPAYGAPANPWQNPGGPTPGSPYAAGTPEGAVPPPPIGPEGPGPGYGYPGYGPQQGAPYYGQQPYGAQPGYGWPHMPLPANNGMGTASLVLGIIATVLFCLWPVAIIVGILAIIFGAIGRGKARRGEANNGGQALAGLICGCVGTAVAVLFLIIFVVNNNDPYDDDPYDFGSRIHVEAQR
ncbi:DUF4190 domain-containing protein, partial [Streptomyces mesophilus]|uniref:DUF4190 domain-containing protein n=1 Tax=Streptomyces mesophilus TaxID=1775132 RepID=UPI00332D8466